jgi:CelD/BcsL family acetyltransferase involved in cellulose biosynthesis
VYSTFPEAEHLQAAWNDLAGRVGDLMASYEWCETWWRYFCKGRRLEIHALHDGDRLVAVLPLFRETLLPMAGLRVLKVLGNDYTIDAVGLAIDPPYAEAVIQRILDSLDDRGGWDALYLGQLRGYTDVVKPLAQAAARHDNVRMAILGLCDDWHTLFDLPEQYEQYLKSLDGDERRDTARRERKLCQGRDVRIEPVGQPEQVPAAMDAVIQLHQQLWTGRGQPGQFGGHPTISAFHRELAGRLIHTGQLALVTATVDGEILAAGYGYHFGRRTHTMFRGYRNDEPWRSYALGRLVHCGQVRQATEHGSRQMEDSRGVFPYKLRLNGRLAGERSLWIVRRGTGPRLRFWLGMRIAYLLHAVYGRIWLDRLSLKLRIHPHAWHCYIRSYYLAKLCKRVRSGMSGGPILWETAPAAPPTT